MSSSNSKQPTRASKEVSAAKRKPEPEKKQPQRGIGVAQLERLRLQERWKKMTEMPSSDDDNNNNGLQQPLESVPVQYVAGGYGGDAVGSGAAVGHGGVVLDHHQLIHYLMMQSPSSDHNNNNNNNISFKKKRFSGEMMREKYNGPTDQVVQMGSPGLNIYANQNNNNNNNIDNNTVPNYRINNISVGDHLTLLAFATPSKSMPISSSSDLTPQNTHHHPHRQGVEIRAVHRRGNIDNNLVMEYEFFPGLNDSVLSPGSASKEEPGSAVVSVGDHHHHHDHHDQQHHQEASSSSSLPYHHHANNLDLSLKL